VQPRSSSADTATQRYGSLLELGRILTGRIAPDDLFPTLADRATRLLPATALLVARYDPEDDQASIVFRSDAMETTGAPASYPGPSCVAIRDRRPVLHLAGDPAAACSALGIDSRDRPALAAPVLRDGAVIATITALGEPGSVYDAADLEFLAALADLLARGPAFVGSEADRQFNTLADHVLADVAALRTDDALDHATAAARELTGAAGTTLWIARAGGEFEVAHSTGLSQRRGERIAPAPAVFRSLADATAPLRMGADAGDDDDPLAGMAKTRPTLVAPLIADGRVLGALTAGFDGREPARSAAGQLQRLAALASVAAAHARLHEQIGALALIDPLTGIPNRRHLGLYLEKEFAAARRGRRLTVLLFEIDDFEQYVRDKGRATADALLRAFGEVLVNQTRAMNLAARFDEYQFVVGLADADRRAGFIHASRIARALEAHALLGPTGIHASVGIASFSPRLKSFDDMLRGARTDLEARRAGTGRLTL
jgi:diguanylate cyclase (GGDEF)-like protein